MEAAEYNDRARGNETLVAQVDELAATAESSGDVEEKIAAREGVELVAAGDRGDEPSESVKAATETSACSVAISRAQRSVEQVHERIEVDQQMRDERDDELVRWHAEDRATEAVDEQAIEDTGPALGDDQQV
ncbi:hypothetical protein [Kribbella lupini]|uniref:Uncharacterized protein n=1 Tax=Kribbella lupini TaxID=291602 RepID=A0ABN2B0A7_9ACTN